MTASSYLPFSRDGRMITAGRADAPDHLDFTEETWKVEAIRDYWQGQTRRDLVLCQLRGLREVRGTAL